VGDLAVFYSGSVDELVTGCIDLALIYKCDPYIFLDRPSEEIELLYKITNDRLRESSSE
jgi:hypothetical protein